MEAKVRARAKGGVSSRIGITGEGMPMMWCDWMKSRQAAQHVAKRLQQIAGRGMVLRRFIQNLLRSALGIDLGGHLLELGLILAQVLRADFEQLIERRVDHLLVSSFLL